MEDLSGPQPTDGGASAEEQRQPEVGQDQAAIDSTATSPEVPDSAQGQETAGPEVAVVASDLDAGARVLTQVEARTGWKVTTIYAGGEESREMFTSPNGKRYVRAGKTEPADVIAPSKTPGLRPLRLKRIDHWIEPTE